MIVEELPELRRETVGLFRKGVAAAGDRSKQTWWRAGNWTKINRGLGL